MKHEIREDGEALVVALKGDVDLESSPAARKLLLDSLGRKPLLLVDLSGVSYIDSSGIASLVETLQRSRKGGGNFALVAVSDAAMRVLQLARLDRVFTIHPSVERALGRG
jgi:anti-sigma B factor antagonist